MSETAPTTTEVPLVTIAIITRNMARSLKDCLDRLSRQTVQDFEVVLVDDRSRDGTREVIEKHGDPRVRYFRNDQKLGYGGTRNLTLEKARGHYIFFTDADCVPERDWLEKGLAAYARTNCLGVVGKTLPLGESTRRSDRKVVNFDGRFMTCNMSFKRAIFEKLGGFDPAFVEGQEDVEFGLRAKQHGTIVFEEAMIIYHEIKPYTLRRLFTDARRYKTQVMIFKRYRHDEYHKTHSPKIARGIFLKPEDWWIIFCPILLFRSPSNQSVRDFLIIPFVYLATVYRRLVIWRTALREKIFLI